MNSKVFKSGHEKDKKKWIIMFSVSSVNLIAVVFILFAVLVPQNKEMSNESTLGFETEQNGRYVLYIGINDKDTYEQIIPTGEAIEIVNDICAKYVQGYTMTQANGGWVDENGILTQENTLVYTIAYSDEEAVIAIMDEVLTALNQNSILIERQSFSGVFYDGKK